MQEMGTVKEWLVRTTNLKTFVLFRLGSREMRDRRG